MKRSGAVFSMELLILLAAVMAIAIGGLKAITSAMDDNMQRIAKEVRVNLKQPEPERHILLTQKEEAVRPIHP